MPDSPRKFPNTAIPNPILDPSPNRASPSRNRVPNPSPNLPNPNLDHPSPRRRSRVRRTHRQIRGHRSRCRIPGRRTRFPQPAAKSRSGGERRALAKPGITEVRAGASCQRAAGPRAGKRGSAGSGTSRKASSRRRGSAGGFTAAAAAAAEGMPLSIGNRSAGVANSTAARAPPLFAKLRPPAPAPAAAPPRAPPKECHCPSAIALRALDDRAAPFEKPRPPAYAEPLPP